MKVKAITTASLGTIMLFALTASAQQYPSSQTPSSQRGKQARDLDVQ